MGMGGAALLEGPCVTDEKIHVAALHKGLNKVVRLLHQVGHTEGFTVVSQDLGACLPYCSLSHLCPG